MLFKFDENIRDTVSKSSYIPGIHEGNIITKVEYDSDYDALDIYYENPEKDFAIKDRMFNPTRTEGRPDWVDIEVEKKNFQSRIKHILRRFLDEEECHFQADSFKALVEILAEKLQPAIENKTPFALKVILDKDVTYPEIPKVGRFMAVEGEPELKFTKWERENRLEQFVEESDSEVSEEETVKERLF